MMSFSSLNAGPKSHQREQECLTGAAAALQKQPDNPYARSIAADCYSLAAETSIANGFDPRPIWFKALKLIEPTVQQYPHYLWGLEDAAVLYAQLGNYARLTGQSAAKKYLDKSIYYFEEAIKTDANYGNAYEGAIGALCIFIMGATSEDDVKFLLAQADYYIIKCKSVGGERQQCYNNYFQVYVKAAVHIYLAGKDPRPQLGRAFENLAVIRKAGGSFLDAEQHDALGRLVDAESRVRRSEDPALALQELQAALRRCFAIASQDKMCRTLAAQADWVTADWLAKKTKPVMAVLLESLRKASLATQALEIFPDSWQVLAETHLRLARALIAQPGVMAGHITQGLAATQKLFGINPNHSLGRATAGALELLRAQTQRDLGERRIMAQRAVASFEQAMRNDAFLAHDFAPLLTQAKALASAPQ